MSSMIQLERLHELRTLAGGERRSCSSKAVYDTFDKAEAASVAHNRWPGRDHDVEPYGCPFCGKFHKGRISPIKNLHVLKIEL